VRGDDCHSAADQISRQWRRTALSSRFRKAIVERQQWRTGMARGTVKWFNSQKGYGFIQPQDGGKDVFVHISAVEKAGLSGLNEGQVVEYDEVPNKGKTSAENLKVQR
jgi:cold shock protein